jgi:phenylalanyl-tRNA synthetase beta chain
MGGLESEVRSETVNVLLESAYFDPTVIRRGSKTLNISTESSQRFERGVDPNGVTDASHRAVQLLLELSGGELIGEMTDQYPQPISPVDVDLRADRTNQLLGTQLSPQEIERYLKSLDMEVAKKNSGANTMTITVPTFRPDVTREVDLIEEVARIHGYDRISATVHAGESLRISQDLQDRSLQRLRTAMCGLGLQEVITNSLADPKLLHQIDYPEEPRPILNPLSEDLSVLRPSLVPGLLQVFAHNRRRVLKDLRIFELGKVFRRPNEGQVTDEKWSLCGLLTGCRSVRFWGERDRTVDFYDLKGLVESILIKLSIDKFHFLPYDEGGFLRSGHSASLLFVKEAGGPLGQVED